MFFDRIIISWLSSIEKCNNCIQKSIELYKKGFFCYLKKYFLNQLAVYMRINFTSRHD